MIFLFWMFYHLLDRTPEMLPEKYEKEARPPPLLSLCSPSVSYRLLNFPVSQEQAQDI